MISVRDLHFSYPGGEFELDVPQLVDGLNSLAHRIALFRETGRVFHTEGELFHENSWIQVMLGQGIVPEQYHPSADVLSDQELTQFLAGIKQGVDRTVARLPNHEEYVRQYCKAARQ